MIQFLQATARRVSFSPGKDDCVLYASPIMSHARCLTINRIERRKDKNRCFTWMMFRFDDVISSAIVTQLRSLFFGWNLCSFNTREEANV